MLRSLESHLQGTSIRNFVQLKNFKDNLEQSQLKRVVKSANIRLENNNNINTKIMNTSEVH